MRNSKLLSIVSVLIGTVSIAMVALLGPTPFVLFSSLLVLGVAFILGSIAYMKHIGGGSIKRFYDQHGLFGCPQPLVLGSGILMVLIVKLAGVVGIGFEVPDKLVFIAILLVLVLSSLYGVARFVKQQKGEL